MDKASKIFVAGAAGMVGSAICRKLTDAGYLNITGSIHTRRPDLEDGYGFGSIRRVEIDLTRQGVVSAFFEEEKPEYVFLAAAKVGGILANSTYPADFIYENMMIAANVIRAAFEHRVKKLLNLGSSCIYPKFAAQPIKEESLLTGALEPTNEAYAVAKISAIKLCRYFNQQYRTDFISAMPTNLYGPGDNFNLETSHVLPALIRKFYLARLLREIRENKLNNNKLIQDIKINKLGYNINFDREPRDVESVERALGEIGVTAEAVTLWGRGEVFREFLYVDDLADACMFLMERFGYADIGELINIGAGKDIRIKDLAETTRGIVGYEGQIRFDVSKPEGTPKKLLDSSRINALGWRPKTPLEKGIRKTLDWYVSQTLKGQA